jgi:predicted  nucleic acid-binding Zn-ribbon protein
VDGLEEKIITEMLAADQIEEEIKTADKKYKEGQERFLKEKNVLQQKRNELEEKRKKLIQEKVILCENCGRILYWLKKDSSHSL